MTKLKYKYFCTSQFYRSKIWLDWNTKIPAQATLGGTKWLK
ncbi:MAG: hypothetical protein ABFQ65_01695 [Nanoarchaeota archaeon]